jgi:hypothetical protein
MMRTFLFVVHDIVSHIERKVNYFIFIIFYLQCILLAGASVFLILFLQNFDCFEIFH